MRRSEAEAEFLGGFDTAAKQDAVEFRRLDARIADLESALHGVRNLCAARMPHDRIAAVAMAALAGVAEKR